MPPTDYDTVVRRELRSMPIEDQRRFIFALNKMAESPKGPGTSVFARLAITHSLHCVHAQETFPAWHRIYLYEFEKALRAADRELGNDGNIALPYWDFCDVERPDVTPAIIREFWSEVPHGGPGGPFIPKEVPADLEMSPKVRAALQARFTQFRAIGFSELNPDPVVCEYIKDVKVKEACDDALHAPEHWKFASKRHARSPSVETPHDMVHMSLGRPLSDLFLAAFHPLFWLLHCNVDRLTSAYLAHHGPVAAEHFRLNQSFLAEVRGEKDRYMAPFVPFKAPDTGVFYSAADTFKTEKLGYVYDSIPSPPPKKLREKPVFAVFPNIPVMPMEGKSYTLHIFAQPDGAAFYMPDGLPLQWKRNASYVGMGSVFGTRGAACENCLDRKPWTLRVDITQGLRRLGLDADTAELYVFAEDEQGVVTPIVQTPIPAVEIRGAIGTAPGAELREGARGRRVERVQRLLRSLDVDDVNGAPLAEDGDFGPLTLSAIRKFQQSAGLTVDGWVGEKTLAWLNRARIDTTVAAHAASSPLPRGQTHTVAIEALPAALCAGGYARITRDAISRSVAVWAAVTNLQFEVKYGRDAAASASVVVAFGETSDGQVRISTDGPGGTFATTTVDGTRRVICFDEEETWVPTSVQCEGSGEAPTDPVIKVDFEAVFLHEFGHALGLSHSEGFDDVMSTYYVPGQVRLTPNDVSLARRLYP